MQFMRNRRALHIRAGISQKFEAQWFKERVLFQPTTHRRRDIVSYPKLCKWTTTFDGHDWRESISGKLKKGKYQEPLSSKINNARFELIFMQNSLTC